MKLSILKGDTVKVITGNDKGKSGRVLTIDRNSMRVTVEGVNIRKHHKKPSQLHPQGGIIEQENSIHYSNVMKEDKTAKPADKKQAKVKKPTASKKASV
ncbi:MAG: 50S ribosomal protein L24 [Bacteroidota bacterium]